MKVTKIGWRLKYIDIPVYKERTFWQWLFRQPAEIKYTYRRSQGSEPHNVEFESIERMLENIVKNSIRGRSTQAFTENGLPFFVDKGRKTLTLQASGKTDREAKNVLSDLVNLFEKDQMGNIPDLYVAERNYRINFNVVDRNAHHILSSQKNTGG